MRRIAHYLLGWLDALIFAAALYHDRDRNPDTTGRHGG